MDKDTIGEITRVLSEFALTKMAARALEVKGPIQEGGSYRWRIVSTRYKEVTILLKTRKLPFSKPSFVSLEVFGLNSARKLQPTPEDLRDFLSKAELVPTT
jgi:hypothetical protein